MLGAGEICRLPSSGRRCDVELDVEKREEPVRRSLAEIKNELQDLAAEFDRINRKSRKTSTEQGKQTDKRA